MTFVSVGPFDLAHGDRTVGVEIDLGAFERGSLFSDGFELAEFLAWGWARALSPAGAFSAACAGESASSPR